MPTFFKESWFYGVWSDLVGEVRKFRLKFNIIITYIIANQNKIRSVLEYYNNPLKEGFMRF